MQNALLSGESAVRFAHVVCASLLTDLMCGPPALGDSCRVVSAEPLIADIRGSDRSTAKTPAIPFLSSVGSDPRWWAPAKTRAGCRAKPPTAHSAAWILRNRLMLIIMIAAGFC